MHAFIAEAYPICRSITGDGVRRTLAMIQERIPLEIHEVADRHAGLRLDGAARVEHPRRLDQGPVRPQGGRLPALATSTSSTTACRSTRAAARGAAGAPVHAARQPGPDPLPHLLLQGGLGLLPGPHDLLEAARRGSTRSASTRRSTDGALTYGECFLPGETEREVLLSTPRLPSVAGQRQPLRDRGDDRGSPRELAARAARRYSYRFLFIPGHDRLDHLARPQRGARRADRARPGGREPRRLRAPFHYKQSRRGNAEIDRAVRARARALGRARSASRTSSPSATTSGSTARPGSTSRRLAHPHAARALSRVPHLGGRPGASSTPEALAGSLAHLPRA